MTVETLNQQLVEESRLLNQLARFRFLRIVSRETYIRYLIQTYHYVVTSVPLMEFALRTDFAAADPGFRRYLAHHIEEEAGHDRCIVNDLRLLGVTAEEVAESHPLPETIHLAGAAYYSIAHRHPVSILGHMHALESAPVTELTLDDLAAQSGVPREAMFTLSEHGERDVDHRIELAAILDRYLGQPVLEQEIRRMAHLTLSNLVALLKAINDPPPSDSEGSA